MMDNIRSEQQPIRQCRYLLPCLHFFLCVTSLLFILSGALSNDSRVLRCKIIQAVAAAGWKFWVFNFLINNLPIDLGRSSMQQWWYEAWKNQYKESDHCIRTYSWDCLGFSVVPMVPILRAEFIKSNYFL